MQARITGVIKAVCDVVSNYMMFSVGQLAALARNLTVDDLRKLDDPNAFDWSAAFAFIKNADAGVIRRAALAAGMRTLRDDGIAKVLQGATTFDEVLRVTREDDDE